MSMRKTAVVALAVLAGACQGQIETAPQAAAGGAMIGLAGGQFGSGLGRPASAAVGVLIGGLQTSEIARGLNQQDRRMANDAINRAHAGPLQQTLSWTNPQSGSSGTVTPLRELTSPGGETCREFQQAIFTSAGGDTGLGVACRQADGTWRIAE